MNKLSPSILAADFARLADEIKSINAADYVHIDVMDGLFVPNISIGPGVVAALRPYSMLTFDVHLMVTEPERFVGAFARAGADIVTFHYEATKDVRGCIKKIKDAGVKVGLAVKPGTDVRVVLDYTDRLDMVLIMSVEPGFGGQQLMPETLEKALLLRQITGDCLDIEMDGGIDMSNVRTVLDSGVNVIVAGTAVFNGDAASSICAFKREMARI